MLRETTEALPSPERMKEFGSAYDCFGKARLVLLGEATPGTSEFYRARAAITRWLIQHHGFTILEFLNWLRGENDSRPPTFRVEFRGSIYTALVPRYPR